MMQKKNDLRYGRHYRKHFTTLLNTIPRNTNRWNESYQYYYLLLFICYFYFYHHRHHYCWFFIIPNVFPPPSFRYVSYADSATTNPTATTIDSSKLQDLEQLKTAVMSSSSMPSSSSSSSSAGQQNDPNVAKQANVLAAQIYVVASDFVCRRCGGQGKR